MIYLSSLMLSLFITLSLIPMFKSWAVRADCVDIPCERKVHCTPIPRIGGIAMALGALVPVLFWPPSDAFINALLIGSGVIVVFGFVDDIRELDYRVKFAAQVVAAFIVISYGGLSLKCLGACLPEGVLLPRWLAVPLTFLTIVGVTNAINLSDGLDGLAGGIMLMTFICICFLAYTTDNYFALSVSVAVIGAIFGFLRFNTYPAVIFMGDTGSQLLGFLAICLSLHITQGNQPLSPLLPLILLGFPILDTLTVMTERIVKGRSPFKPDKNHFHHKLMKLGLYHTEAVLTIYVLQSMLILAAIQFRFHSEWFLLLFYAVFSGAIIATFTLLERRQWQLARTEFLDKIIKGRLRGLKERQIVIALSFRFLKAGLPALLMASCLLSDGIPGYFAILTGAMAVLLIVVLCFRPALCTTVMRIGLYLVIPFLVYMAESGAAERPLNIQRLYHLAYGVVVAFVFLTLKFTRRRKGFKTTPMDFLVLFIALVVPSITSARIQNFDMGMLAAQIIVLIFGYEVLMGELRGELKGQVLIAAVALGTVTVKYLI
jgi:UDP-GlcNAc:undecaprenyl-phosphate/decaprenyl-phosphate GlcNAc-1-phosphate transferase